MTRKQSPWPWFGLGLLVGAAGGWLLARRPRGTSILHMDVWQREMVKTRGTVGAALLARRVQTRYAELYAQRPRFTNPALRDHLERHILPGLALYQTLRADAPTQEAALDETEAILGTSWQRMRRMIALLGKAPNAYSLFRVLVKLNLWLKFPAEGWHIEMVEDSDRCIAFDIRDRCLYRDVLTAYGAPELTARFCALDDWLYAALPPTIRWERTTTLGRGDECCNFRYCRGDVAPAGDTTKTDVQQLDAVSETLLLPLAYRAAESRRPDALIHDAKAADIVARLDYDFSKLERQAFQQLNIALRSREFDRAVRVFLEAHPDGVVVDIGCGLDARFERVDNGRVTWFSLDFPQVIALREQFFAPHQRCHTLACSALDFVWLDEVAQHPGPYFFLAEGVFPYLAEDQVRRLVSALCDRFPGAELMFDALPTLMVSLGRLHPALRQTRAARVRWGLGNSRILETWGAGRLLSDWRYYDQSEPRLGWYKVFRYIPFLRDFRILRYRLGAA